MKRKNSNNDDFYQKAPTSIVTVSPEGLIYRINSKASELLELSQSEALNKNLLGFIDDAYGETFLDHLSLLDKGGRIDYCEVKFKHPSKGHIFARLNSSRDSDHNCIHIIINNLTEHIKKEETLSRYQIQLERIVEERTSGLIAINDILKKEIEERTKIQKKLAENEKEYRELVENANSIIMRKDSTGRITFFNEYAQKFFGYTEEEIIGKHVIDTIVPKTESTGRNLQDLIKKITKAPENYTLNENENITRTGERVWISWSNKGIFDKKGKLSEILCVGNDITELKKLEEKNRISQETAQAILNSSTNPILLLDPEGRILEINSTGRKILSAGVKDIIGTNIFELLPEYISKRKKEFFDKVIKTKEPVKFEDSRDNLIFEQIISPVIDTNGDVNRIAVFAYDVTEKKLTEDSLRKAEKNYRELIENINSIILKINRSYKITFINSYACNFFGFTQKEIIGRKIFDTILPEKDSENNDYQKMINQIFKEPESFYTNENENIMKNKERVWVSWKNTPIYDNNGRLEELLCIGNDITFQKKYEKELKRNFKTSLSILNAIEGRIIHIDSSGIIYKVNRTALKALGKTEDDIIGKNIFDLYPRNVTRILHEKILKAVETNETVTYESSFEDGFFQTSIFPHIDNTHKVSYLTLHDIDKTEIKKMKDRCNNLEVKSDLCPEARHRAFFIQNNKLEYTWIENRCNFFPSDNMIGMKDNDITDEVSAKKLTRVKRKVLRNLQEEEFELQIKHNKKAQDLHFKIIPLIDENGESTGLSGIVTDLSFIKESLSKTENIFQNLIDNSFYPLLIIDSQSIIKAANTRSLIYFSTNLNNIEKRDLYDLIPKKSAASFRKAVNLIFEIHQEQELTYTNSNKEITIKLLPIFIRDKVTHAVVIFDEKIESCTTEDLKKLSENELVRIGHDLHDEIGQYFTGIGYLANVLQKDIEKADIETPDSLIQIKEQIDKAKKHISLMSRGLSSLDLNKKNFFTSVKEHCINIQNLFNVKCKFKYDSDLKITCSSAALHLYHIIQEATNNAIRHSNADIIEINMERHNRHIALQISDNGKGFEGDLSICNGIGLKLIKFRAQLLDGEISITNSDSGGAIISLILDQKQLLNFERKT